MPEVITRQLGIEPSHGWRKGDPFIDVSGVQRRRYNGLWLYEAKNMAYESPCEHIMQAIRRTKGRLELCRRECHDEVDIDVCLWVEAAESSFVIERNIFEAILDERMDGLNISFIGIDDSSSMEDGSTISLTDDEAAYFRISMACDGGVISSILRRGRLSYNSNKNLSLFYQKVQMQKKKMLEVPQSCISADLQWRVPHGALYFGRDLLRLFCDLNCAFVRFTFRNAPG